MQWLRHAFQVDTAEEAPRLEELELVNRVAREVVRRRLTTPALAFLEMARPLNFLGAQALHFFAPILTVLFDRREYEMFSHFLERRDAVDRLCSRIEELEQSVSAVELQQKKATDRP